MPHTDLHPLNVLVSDRPRIVDWAWARKGRPWVDLAFLHLRLMLAGHEPHDDEVPDEFVVAVYGMWLYNVQRGQTARAGGRCAAVGTAPSRFAPMSEDDEDEFAEDDEFEDEEDPDDLFAVTPEPRTVCHLCGGASYIAAPTLAIIGGAPRTVDNGRECPHCKGARTFNGLIPPV